MRQSTAKKITAIIGGAKSEFKRVDLTPELARKIGVTRLGLQDLVSADVAGRAVGSLVQSGVPLATAMSLVEWDNVPLPHGASKPIPHGGE